MKRMSERSKLAFGVCVIVATLSSGCSVVPKPTMTAMDLENFQIDCRHKQEQIAFLESQRSSPDDRLGNRLVSELRFWENYTNPAAANHRRNIYTGQNDWLINQKLQRLKWDCGPGTSRR